MSARLPRKKKATYHKPICQPKRPVVDGITFDSQHEATVYGKLKLLERAGVVRSLQTQVPYALLVKEVPVCKYVADFTFDELVKGVWEFVVLDAKQFRTPIYRLKKKLMLAVHGIVIREE